jgi:hypothetical protein
MPRIEQRARDWIHSMVLPEFPEDTVLRTTVLQAALSLYFEDTLIALADRPLLLWPGATSTKKLNAPMLGRDPEAVVKDDILWAEPPTIRELQALINEEGMDGDLPRNPIKVTFLFAGGVITETPQGGVWTVRHAYDKRPLPNGAVLSANDEELHYSQAAGLACLHPIAEPLFTAFPSVANVVRAKLWRVHRYDPCGYFSGGEQDGRGFVGGGRISA